MLTREGEARDGNADRSLAWSLAAIAGALNAASFTAADLYASNMTGNVSAFASNLALASLAEAAVYGTLVLTFIAGAAVCALLVNAGRRRQESRIYAYSILAEAVLMALLGLAGLTLEGGSRGLLLAYGLSFLMGLQNAIVTRISAARVRTTHVTGMVTDIGIEIGNLIDRLAQGSKRQAAPDAAARDRLWLHVFTVLSFLAGGIVGVLAFRSLGPSFLFVAALILLALAVPGLKRTAPPG